METAAVHNGEFHADDAFAIAILKLTYPKLKVIRTRDPEEYKSVDTRVDVGREYNPKTQDYDHHQPEFQEKRKNGVPYASAGLIWKHYGKQLIEKEGWKVIDEKLIQFVDADDNGLKVSKTTITEPYTISKLIETMNPTWLEKDASLYDLYFFKAVDLAITVLKKEIELAKSEVKAKEIICTKLAETKKEYLVLDEYMPFQDVVREKSPLKFVIFPDSNRKNAWVSTGVRKEKGNFKIRKYFPEQWAGLVDEQLQERTGVKDAVFCHKDCFVVVAKSKEGAIKLTELALKS